MKMTPNRDPLRGPWVVWLAVLIAVLSAVAPTVTHALISAAVQSPQGAEICTSDGPRWVATEAAQSSDEANLASGSFASSAHCQFCLQSTDSVALINDLLPYPFMGQYRHRKSTVWQVFLYVKAHSVNPPSRGPPGFFELLNA
jgi:hypothetical protein